MPDPNRCGITLTQDLTPVKCSDKSQRSFPWALLASWLIISLDAASAEVVTLDFETPGILGVRSLLDKGFIITSPDRFQPRITTGTVTSSNGTHILQSLSTNPPMRIAHLDGATFTPLTVDLAEYSIYAKPPNNQVPVVAKFPDGHEETHNFTLDGVLDGVGPLQDFQTLAFPSSWVRVTSVTFTQTFVAFDNLVVEGTKVPNIIPPKLPDNLGSFQILAQLPPNNQEFPGYYWDIITKDGTDLLLGEFYRQSTFDGPLAYLRIRPNGSSTLYSAWQNPFTEETVLEGQITIDEENEQYAPTLAIQAPNEDPVSLLKGTEFPSINRINWALPENGKIAFLNQWYGGDEKYAVFIASQSGVVPVVLPDTILPDGGVPASFPYDLSFAGGTVAFQSSSSLNSQKSRWFLKFPNQPLRFGLALRDSVPGETQLITSHGRLVLLDENRARYFVNTSNRSFLVETNSLGVHQILASSIVITAGRVIPGYGVRVPSTGGIAFTLDVTTGQGYYGASVRADESSFEFGATLSEQNGELYVIHADAESLPGLSGAISLVPTYATDGWFYAVVTSNQNSFLVKGQPSFTGPKPRLAGIVNLNGQLRFTAEFLTLDKSYDVERAEMLDGPWTKIQSFMPGSISRSLPAPPAANGRGFYRLRYLE
jgi:hypothetical protein